VAPVPGDDPIVGVDTVFHAHRDCFL
jgi:hypothetical protein